MNLVKGVADLIRRTSASRDSEAGSGSRSERLPSPSPKIQFSDVGDEAILSALWERYKSADDEAEKKRLFNIFLKQFLVIYQNWDPVYIGQSPDAGSLEISQSFDEVVIGCSAAHPAEIVLILVEEMTHMSSLVPELNNSGLPSSKGVSGFSMNLTRISEGLVVLDALAVVTRSMHNCRVFGYYGGVQSITALMKAAVVQLKTVASALSADERLPESGLQKTSILQKVLVKVVLIMYGFINHGLYIDENDQGHEDSLEHFIPRGSVTSSLPSVGLRSTILATGSAWHQKAVVSVMEAGGLIWLVELLRVTRRLCLKEQWTDASLQYLTLGTLLSALNDNPRGQNHFRSIGGLEVLLDGLGVLSSSDPRLHGFSSFNKGRHDDPVLGILQLHVLSLEVLREAVFGNLNNLQFLCENGRVQKFANSFCSPAFMFQDFSWQSSSLDQNGSSRDAETSESPSIAPSFSHFWRDYTLKLSRILSSFLLPLEDVRLYHVEQSTGTSGLTVSLVYGELSIKWVMRVLRTVFPCIKACSNQNELPSHLRAFVYALQHYVLFVFRRLLFLSPSLLDKFRAEGVWDFIFSEHFFFFEAPSVHSSEESHIYGEVLPWNFVRYSGTKPSDNQVHPTETNFLQVEIISLVEFAGTLDGSSHNLPECSVLLEALEQSACNAVVVIFLAKSLLRMLQLVSEKTRSAFKTINAVPRVLKIACVLARESTRPVADPSNVETVSLHSYERSDSTKMALIANESIQTSMELFAEYFSATDEEKNLILHSSACVDCLFDLFWEEGLRSRVLAHILDLLKIIPFSEEDQKAKSYLCSKYLEMFTHVKEREKNFAELAIELLVGLRGMLFIDQMYFQALFREGECFLHVVSLLNGTLGGSDGENLVLNVLQTLTLLLTENDASKATFRALVGPGYQTLQSLLLDFCQQQPSEGLLDALLDMLVDGKFNIKGNPIIMNEDAILLYLGVLQKSSDSLQNNGLNIFLQLLRDSISNRASCISAGILTYILDWFPQEHDDSVVMKIAQLIQVIGGHSISGKDIRKIFALLRSSKVGTLQRHRSLLLTSVSSMLNEKGPTAFFDFNGNDSGIIIKTPMQWPQYKGFTFTCWLRIENFPRGGTMGLFSFLSANKKGCLAVLGKDRLIYESVYQKRQTVSLPVNLVRKRWHFLCITHSIGRAFSTGSQVRCYVDGVLASSEKCRYAKVNEDVNFCVIGTKIKFLSYQEESATFVAQESSPFFGQIGPVYVFSDALTSEQVHGIFSLGPSYMYSFLDTEITVSSDSTLPGGFFDARDDLASKLLLGLNSKASNGRRLFNVSVLPDLGFDKKSFEATVSAGTKLCSRCLLQEIIYCVGGVSVFFPLFTHFDLYEKDTTQEVGCGLLTQITKERLTAEIFGLIASVLDDSLANQQQMVLLSGFSIMGLLLQAVPPQELNMEMLSALKHLFNVIANCSLSDVLVKVAISHIFLNPLIWVYTTYRVQRELYMFLIQQFDNDPRLLKNLCRLPRVLDIIYQFYWDDKHPSPAVGSMSQSHPGVGGIVGEVPSKEEMQKIRLLLLSLCEMSLRQSIAMSDIKSLIAFFETSQDLVSIEDVLHMVIRSVSQKPQLASFLEQINLIGGCHVFVNLLERDCEPVRLLSLQFIGRLLVGLPSEKKGTKFFNISVGRSKSLSETHKRDCLRMQPIFFAMSDRLFRFPRTDFLCATLFDVLLGGASPKQVLQKHNQLDRQRSKGSNSQFCLPQVLVLIFKFLSYCEDVTARVKIIGDLLDLLDSNALNIEAFMESGWNAWLLASVKLDALKNYKVVPQGHDDNKLIEEKFVRTLFCVVLSHYVHFVKGGWQHLEETTNFLLLQCEQVSVSYRYLLRDIYEDLMKRLIELSSDENIFVSQPCRDNTLYLLKLIDELLIFETDNKLPFPASDLSPEFLELESDEDLGSLFKTQQGDPDGHFLRQQVNCEDDKIDEDWWNLYDNVWVIMNEMNGKGQSKLFPKSSSAAGPSIGQRARGLVESLNIPAAEMAAVVVSGGISNALGGKQVKNVDKAMLLRGEKCLRIVFRLAELYLCKSSLGRASRCVQQAIHVLPCLLTADDEQCKSRLQLFIWTLLAVRARYGTLDDGARFHVISHLIQETISYGKSILIATMAGRDDSSGSISKGTETIQNLIQKDRVLSAVSDESKYITTTITARARQLRELQNRLDGNESLESSQQRAFEGEIQSTINAILASDTDRRASCQLSYDEEKQFVAEKWIHVLRTLIDERGPWSANPFPNSIMKWWKLDRAEDTWRRRQKLRKNYHFDEKLCHPPSNQNDMLLPVTEPKSGFGDHLPKQMKRFLLKGIHKITEEGSSDLIENDDDLNGKKSSVDEVVSERQISKSAKDDNDLIDFVPDRKNPTTMSTESEYTEVLASIPCVLVTPKRKVAGHLAVLKKCLLFSSDFLVEGTGGSSVFEAFSSKDLDPKKSDELGVHKQKLYRWPISLDLDSKRGSGSENMDSLPISLLQKQLKNIKRHRRWDICKIRAVHWTRYLLRYTAIEIFFSDSVGPIFLNFASRKDAKDVGTLIVATRNESMISKVYREKPGVISFVDRRVALEMAEAARESWRRRDITNFEYLMILNTLAGRSYNDLTQYPVFPWVLADYSSESLDFNKSSTFRDLSKPVGALDPKRFEVFEDRYRSFSDPDIPSFYYGSHYSSMGIVLFYLLRLEPFTSLHRTLQGGKFDHADRLFQSIEGTYRNCLSNSSDVKELVPEFFYMPEFLVNSNSYHFGVKQDGEPLGDVCLPPWAKGSPEEFIHKHREALESEYVSSNLHHWIDLVFGYKQRGKPAAEAANVFYYLTYEGAVDLDGMEDKLQRSAIEDQISNFGQTPIQIFRKKHPRRGPPIPIAHPLRFAPGSINLTTVLSSTSTLPSAVLFVDAIDTNVVLINQGLTMSIKMWLTTQLQSGGNFTFSGSQDHFFGIGSDVLSPRKIGSPLAENIEIGAQCFAIMHTPSENFLISCGNWENSFQVTSLTDGRLVQSIRQHKDVVSCVAVTSDGSVLASGSYDTTVMVWEVLRPRTSEKKMRNFPSDVLRRDCLVSETPFHILCGHDDIITCLYVSAELDVVISGSKDGTCVFHTLREGRYIRSLQHPSGCAISKLVASRHGRIVYYADDDLSLHLYSINGKHLETSESNGRLNCIELSSCGEFLVCAGDQGQIVVRSVNSLETIQKYSGVGKVITSLCVTQEECFIAGAKDGTLLVYSLENLQLQRTSLSRNLKAKSSAS